MRQKLVHCNNNLSKIAWKMQLNRRKTEKSSKNKGLSG